ncbi:hypothetical protein V6Z11_D11G183600 [Gossypium hirsutum]
MPNTNKNPRGPNGPKLHQLSNTKRNPSRMFVAATSCARPPPLLAYHQPPMRLTPATETKTTAKGSMQGMGKRINKRTKTKNRKGMSYRSALKSQKSITARRGGERRTDCK